MHQTNSFDSLSIIAFKIFQSEISPEPPKLIIGLALELNWTL